MRKLITIALFFTALPLFADDARRIERELTVRASRADVWKAWTTSAGAKTFFAPDVKIELMPGGAYEIYFNPDAPAGSRGGESNQVVAFEPERMLLVTWNAPPKFGPVYRSAHTFVMIRFDDAPGGGTRVRLTHFGWRDGGEWNAVRDYFEHAWDYVIDEFKKQYA
jgi:uncharacterized protein YndB with AHSA1/START domain